MKNTLNAQKKVIIYCRESRDDFGENYERIETQRDILINFCKKEGYENIVDIILDDNVSGTNFKRLDGICEKAKTGEVDVVVFKDASRLGRNQIESLKFIDTLERNNVEIVFESEKYNEDFFPLLAWFNEQRAKEDSKKIRRVFKHKMETGELIIKPVYGYEKIDGKLIIIEEEAVIIREVFNLFLEGKGTYQIATILNYKGVLTPSQRRNQNNNLPICYAWNRQHIYRILADETYTGNMVYSKREITSFKNKKNIYKDKADWIIIKDHHEPIIDKDIFNEAQLLKRKLSFERNKSKSPKLFTGLLVCGRCGSNLVQRVRKNRKDAYICAKNHKEGAIKDEIREYYGCLSHHITEEDLLQCVHDYFKQNISHDIIKNPKIHREKQSTDQLLSLKKQVEFNITKTEKIIEQIYDDKLNGNINQDLFTKKSKEYNDKINDLKNQLNELNQKYISILKNTKTDINIEVLLNKIKCGNIKNIDMKNAFTKIICYLPNEIDEKDKIEYMLSDETYSILKENGGIYFVEKYYNATGFMVQL